MDPRQASGVDPRRPVVLGSSYHGGALPTVHVITSMGPGDEPAILMPARLRPVSEDQ